VSAAILVMDAGNTRIKWGLHEGDAWRATGAVGTREAGALTQALAALPLVPGRVLAANVAGAPAREAIEAAARALGVRAGFLVASAQCCGVRNGYREPGRLGADRWAALVGARTRVAGPCVVANAGTAITVDALDGAGSFLGGMILPGVDLMLRVLAQGTADLVAARGAFAEFPDATADAMTTGALSAAAGAVVAMVARVRRRCGAEPALLLTGGGAPELLPLLPADALHLERLVLEGLVAIAAAEPAP
jgi:type III pantothenate kinase